MGLGFELKEMEMERKRERERRRLNSLVGLKRTGLTEEERDRLVNKSNFNIRLFIVKITTTPISQIFPTVEPTVPKFQGRTHLFGKNY